MSDILMKTVVVRLREFWSFLALNIILKLRQNYWWIFFTDARSTIQQLRAPYSYNLVVRNIFYCLLYNIDNYRYRHAHSTITSDMLPLTDSSSPQ